MNRQLRLSRMQGLTLIELMIALVLSLLVAAVMISMYLSNTQGAAFQSGVLRVQENGRFAIDMISRAARMAGYIDPTPSVVLSPVTPAIEGTDGSVGASDTLTIRYEGGTGILDCQGQVTAAGSWVRAEYSVINEELVCTTASGPEALADGVEDLQIFYGEDLDGDGTANRYVPADSVTSWDNIVTIQAAVLVNSVANAIPAGDGVCIGCSVFTAVNDARLRGEFITTINIRN